MTYWLVEGKIKTRQEIITGIDNAPEALIRMWQGNKLGEMVLKIEDQ